MPTASSIEIDGRLSRRVEELLARRTEANANFFASAAGLLAQLCHRAAERFSRGGRLIALGCSPQARSDARHVAVEFVHPVIVGKRALPAMALTDGAACKQVELMAQPRDMLLAFGSGPEVLAALQAARRRGCLTVAFEASGAEWELEPPVADPLVRQELVETAYHVLWELVHVFFEHRGVPAASDSGSARGGGAASFLYPFLAARERTPESLIDEVCGSIQLKAQEIGALREQTLREGRETLIAAARAMRGCFQAGGALLALGNGGSATDAMDAVADLRHPLSGWRARRAIDLTEDPAILTAIANDVGVEAVFAREVIANGREGDVLLAFSTSGGSGNVIEALVRARAQGLITIAMVGYDGGRIASEGLADHLLVTRSEHIPRIQEAQASAWHLLRELIEEPV